MGAGRNWLLGCGIGCGVVLLIIVLVAGGSFYMLRDTIRGFRQIEESQSTLVEAHGRIDDFRPLPDGRIPPARMAAFLAVRDTTAAARDELTRALNVDMPALKDEGKQGVAKLLQGLKAGVGFTGAVADYLRERGAAMLAQEMGLGEYLYTYSLVYYSWLGKDPGEGPTKVNVNVDDRQDDKTIVDNTIVDNTIVWGDAHGDWSDPDIRRQRLRQKVRGHVLPMLESQLAADDTSGGSAWRAELAAEVARLRADVERLPWQDGLPAPLRESLEPHRAQLEAQWSDAANMLEILTLEEQEGRAIRVESSTGGQI